MQLSNWKPSTHGLRKNSKSQTQRKAPNALLEDTERTTNSRDPTARSNTSTISLPISSTEIATELRK